MRIRKENLRGMLGAVIAVSCLGTAAYAQAAPAALDRSQPTAGSTQGDLHQKQVQAPVGTVPQVQIDVKEEERPPLDVAADVKVKVSTFKITGQQVVPDAVLQKMTAGYQGKLVSFGDLQKIADELTNYFKAQGYLVARVYLPTQKITNGVVEYAVVIGKFDTVTVNNHTKIHDSVVQREIQFLEKGAYIKRQDIERAVWLLSDLAGADAKMTISPGSMSGTSSMVIDLRPHEGKNGDFFIDNYGNRYTGYTEYGLDYDFLNPFHEGDHLALSFITTGKNLKNGSINYTIPILRDGLTMNAGYSRLNYSLGKEYEVLDAYGTAGVYHIGLDYAIRRSQRNNLYTGFRFESSKLRDEYRAAGIVYSDKHSNAGILSLYGDEQDAKGMTGWRAEVKLGTLGFDSDVTHAYFDDTNIEGTYAKFNANILRRQSLNDRTYLLLSARGQYSSRNLDSSERMSLGGISGVRAYPQSEASGDIGYLTRAELRWLLPLKKQDQTLQLAAYLDHGAVRANKSGGADNYRKLQGMGLGLIWSRKDDWWLRTDYAWRLGAERPSSDTTSSNGQFWIQGGVYF